MQAAADPGHVRDEHVPVAIRPPDQCWKMPMHVCVLCGEFLWFSMSVHADKLPCWHMPACGTVHGCITQCTYVNVHTSQQTSSKSIHRNCHRPERAMHALAQCSVHCPSPPLGPACSSFFLKFLSSCKPFPPFTPSLPTVLALQHLNSTGSQILTQLSPRPVWDFSLQAPWMVLGKQLVPLDIGI